MIAASAEGARARDLLVISKLFLYAGRQRNRWMSQDPESVRRLHLKLLGPFEAGFDDGQPVQITLAKAQLLLAFIALAPTRRVGREAATALLWSDRSEAQGRQSLRQTLAVIRRVLGRQDSSILEAGGDTIGLARDAVVTDAACLTDLARESGLDDLERAAAAWRGDFLEGLSVRDAIAHAWLSDRRAEFRALAMRCFGWLLDAYGRAERHADLERLASRMLGIDPLSEEAHSALIRLHLARGERAKALQQYRRCRELLRRELSVEPSAETTALVRSLDASRETTRRVLPAVPAGHELPDAASSWQGRDNLPRRMPSLVGRETEIEEVTARLRRYGLVTLTGAGGAGKTRMAIEVGRRMSDAYRDGVWLVELAPVQDPEIVPETICGTLGIPVERDRSAMESALANLCQREALLILDNCEHLVIPVATVAETILRACPSISILATSRESLSIAGESIYRVPSLTFPGRTETITAADALAYSAVQLFVQRASATINDFALTDGNAPAVASICKQADGIPLAIELTVPHLKMMPAERLAERLHDSFRSVRTGSRTVSPRHQTLQTLLDWSYDLLDEDERTVLRRLSVFTGGCTLDSAMKVVSGVPVSEGRIFGLLSALVEKSLLVPDLSAGNPRYRLLEITRQYAFDALRASGERGLRRRLAAYLSQMFTDASETWATTPTRTWLTRYEPEVDNLRASLEWAFGPEGDAALGVGLASIGVRIWDELSHFRERARWCEIALAHCSESTAPEIVARLHLSRTWNSAHGDRSGFLPAQQAAEMYRRVGDTLGLGEALSRAGAALLTLGTVEQATPYLDQALAVLEPLGPTKPLAGCLRSKGVAAYFQKDIDAARHLIARSATVARSVGDTYGVASAQIALAELEFSAGEAEAAVDEVRHMLASRNHSHRQATLGYGNLASYLLSIGRIEEGREAARMSLQEAWTLGWSAAIVRAGEHLALAAALTGHPEVAARLLGYAVAFYGKGTASREFTEQVTYERLTAELAQRLSPARLRALMAEGEGWNEKEAAEAAMRAAEPAGFDDVVVSPAVNGKAWYSGWRRQERGSSTEAG